jgi:Ca2+-binding RTX toxin-like protein
MAGSDTLTGGTGADTFAYDRFGSGGPGPGTGTGGIDTITDFHGHASEGDRIDLRTLTNLTTFSQITNNAVETGSGATLKTTITFAQDPTTQLVLQGVALASLTASDFIFAIPSPGSSIAVAVQTPDGYTSARCIATWRPATRSNRRITVRTSSPSMSQKASRSR